VPVSDATAYAIARALRAERSRAGLSQDVVAARLGLSRVVVSNMERGVRRVSADELPEVCAALGITLNDLFAKIPAEEKRILGI